MRKASALAALFLLLTPGGARAAIIERFADRDAFLLRVPVSEPDTVTFAEVGFGPLINLVGSGPTAGAGLLRIGATPGRLFGNGTVLSTEIDRATLVLNFSQPLSALGLSALVTDEALAPVAGSLLLDAVGSGISLAATGAAAGFQGILSDVPFSSLRITVAAFDQDATAVAFPALTSTVYLGIAPPAAVPAPGFTTLLAPALALAVSRRSRQAARGVPSSSCWASSGSGMGSRTASCSGVIKTDVMACSDIRQEEAL